MHSNSPRGSGSQLFSSTSSSSDSSFQRGQLSNSNSTTATSPAAYYDSSSEVDLTSSGESHGAVGRARGRAASARGSSASSLASSGVASLLPRGIIPTGGEVEMLKDEEITPENIVKDELLKTMFRVFLAKSFCSENFDFYLAVEDFKHNHRIGIPAPALRERAFDIYEKYLKEESDSEINVNTKVKQQMQEEKNNLEASTGTPNINFFDEAQKSISFLLQTDTVPKFLSSSDYKTVKELREVEHKLPNLLGTLAALKEEIEKVETEVDHFSNKKEMLEEYVRNSVAEADRMLKERNDQLEEMEKERVRREKEAEKERLKKEKEAEKERLKKEREERKKEGGGGGVFQDSIMGSMGLANLGPPRPKKKEHKIKLGEDSYIFYVDVLQAKDLVARDQSGKPTKANAYITVRVGRHKETTKVVMNSNNPKWYESFIFVLKPGEPQKVKVEAVQYNVMGKPTPIGVLQFPAAKSFSEQGGGVKQLHWFSFEAAVEGAPPGEGKLQLSLDYHRVLGKKEETECEISKVQQLIASLEGESADSKKKGKISSGDKKLVKILKQKESKLQKSLATM